MHNKTTLFTFICAITLASLPLRLILPAMRTATLRIMAETMYMEAISLVTVILQPPRFLCRIVGLGFRATRLRRAIIFSAYYYRNQKHGEDDCDDDCHDHGSYNGSRNSGNYNYAQVQEIPYHGYWHGEGDHVYVYNSAIYN